ncbi:MAG: TlpA family protein disulfide reductase [Bacteroidetes bacterium]|nr:TlpA family protein disulfide reductase [Bacteroidota bacterium]
MKQAIIALVLFFICNEAFAQQSTMPAASALGNNYESIFKSHVGNTYVPFDITTTDGRHLTNQSCKGKIVVLNFWFEDCGGCRGEIKYLNALYDSLKKDTDVEFVAVTFDKKETLPSFIKTFKLNYPIATISSQNEAYRMNYRMGFPTNIILDKSGKVAMMKMGISDKESRFHMSTQQVYDKISSLKAVN